MSFATKNEIIFCDGIKQEKYSKVTFESVYLGNSIYVQVFPYNLKFQAAIIIRSRPINQPIKLNLFINNELSKSNVIPKHDLKNSEHVVFALDFNMKFDFISKFKIEIVDSKNVLLCERMMNILSGPSPMNNNKLIISVDDM